MHCRLIMFGMLAFGAANVALSNASVGAGENAPEQTVYAPRVLEASDEGEKALSRIRIPAGWKIELFAAEPMLANPVAFCIDRQGRFYVAETFRHHAGVTDNRNHMDWLADDLASRTVADRVAMYKKFLGNDFAKYVTEHERVRRIEDTDGDGRADRATIFADGFRDAADGIGAGLLARDGNVWFACIPSLWRLRDANDDGVADERDAVQSGYGVHVAFLGHDLHGLKLGPDGRMYFSIGDRGFHVQHEGKTISYPDTGAVLRCNLDGSELEVVHAGLRNPQELAFDEYGNLFTGDNNSDGGDKARWVHVIDGGDSGWRIGYQYLNTPYRRGPWNGEKLWFPPPEGEAAYLVPPLANVADGPSGLTYYPGTGLSDDYRGRFFLCDFRGSAGFSGVRSLRLEPNGATFEVTDVQQPIWSVLATDIDFGNDGAIYLTDWVDGWDKPGKGRIYKLYDPTLINTPAVQEVKKLLAESLVERPEAELLSLLGHADMRVRQEAQFALAAGKSKSIPALQKLAAAPGERFPRIHALWALGQIGREDASALAQVAESTRDADSEIRAQAAKVLGDARLASAAGDLIALLGEAEPRVQMMAALALGRIKAPAATPALVKLLRDNADQDRYLRHAAVMGLVGCAASEELNGIAWDESPAVRMGALLAMRRLKLPAVKRFLLDELPAIVLEAARAIYDEPIIEGYVELANRTRSSLAEPVLLRALAANAAIGSDDAAARVADVAGDPNLSELIRLEALATLGDWESEQKLDRFLGAWRPRGPHASNHAGKALARFLPALLDQGSEKIRQAAAEACGKLALASAAEPLAALIRDSERPAETRIAAISALGAIGGPLLDGVVEQAVQDKEPAVRTEGLRWLAKVSPAKALPVLAGVLQSGTIGEQQGAFTTLGEMDAAAVESVFVTWLDRLLAGEVDARVQLELLEAAARQPSGEIKQRLAKWNAGVSTDDPLGRYREALVGGDEARGRTVFFEKTAVACMRCHKIGPRGGEVGPDLSHVAKGKERAYLLEALVAPNRKIAEGFETVVVATADGKTITGVFKGEDDRELRITTFEGTPVVIPKNEIEDRARGLSAMPEQAVQQLTKRELRDLLEFLANQK